MTKLAMVVAGKENVLKEVILKSGIALASLIAGIAAQPIVEDFLQSKTVDEGLYRLFIVIGISLSLLTVFIAILLEFLVSFLLKMRSYDLYFHVDKYILGPKRKVIPLAFSYCSEIALNAKKSILVVGPHFERRNNSEVEETGSHDDYLEHGVMTALRRHLQSGDSGFKFERIIQLDQGAWSNAKKDNYLTRRSFNNPGMAEHIKELIDLSNQHPNADFIKIHARRFIPSFPSILLVDDKYVFFSLPTDPEGSPGEALTYDTVLGFYDESGKIPIALRHIVTRFRDSASALEVREVKDN